MAVILAGFFVLWLVLEGIARATGSLFGEWGLLVGFVVVVAAVLVERVAFKAGWAEGLLALGLGRPRASAMVAALAISAALLAIFPAYAIATGTQIGIRENWWLLLPGLFAQGGIAEEVVFRGYLFRHIRERMAFWKASGLAAVPFVLVHLTAYLTVEPVVATASLVVALSLTFPFSWLFEKAGNSIWPGAILHCTIQGAIKLVVAPEADFMGMALTWMAVSAALPWLVFVVLRKRIGAGVETSTPGPAANQ